MTYEEKNDMLDDLYCKLDTVKAKLSKSPANTILRIQKHKIRKEIEELKMTITNEEFGKMMKDVIDIDVNKCQ